MKGLNVYLLCMKPINRIIINTFAQFSRSIIKIFFSFYTIRIVLDTLGVIDYGIYSVIAGSVALLSFITTSLSIATQRFLSVSQGKSDISYSITIFNTSLKLHICIGVFVLLCLEILYPIIFNYVLNIPNDRLLSAQLLYHSVAIVVVVSLIVTPYRAVIISHENIVYSSFIDIIDSILKFLIALFLGFVDGDKLLFYGFSLICIQLFNLLAFSLYSYSHYLECSIKSWKVFSRPEAFKLFNFSGWTMYNIACIYCRTQGIAFSLNQFMGPAINAAYGISYQISGALNSMSSSLLSAINPQLMKLEGKGDRSKMLRFAELESKFGFLLLVALAVPSFFEMPRLLKIWLVEVPDNSILFSRMVILGLLADMLTVGLGSANQAIGNIKRYTLIIYSLKLFPIISTIFILINNLSLVYIAVSYVITEFVTAMLRIYLLNRNANLDISQFFVRVIYKEILPLIIIVGCSLFLSSTINWSLGFIFTFSISIIIYSVSVYKWGLCNDEKTVINTIRTNIYHKIMG